MSITIPEIPKLELIKLENLEPVLSQIDEQDDSLLQKVKSHNYKIAKKIISEYGINKSQYIDIIFKKNKKNYENLRIELQKFINERKEYLENAIKNLC
jgi:hypothetical protein